MEVYLIRHTTPAVAKGIIYGRTEVDLAESFTRETIDILNKIPEDIDFVYSSPSRRCTLLASKISPQYKTDPRLQEVDFGLWEGETWETVDQQALNDWMEDFVNVSPPGGESMIQMHNRVMAFCAELLQQPHQKAAIVTHGGVIRLILAASRQVPLSMTFDIKVSYGDIFLVQGSELGMRHVGL